MQSVILTNKELFNLFFKDVAEEEPAISGLSELKNFGPRKKMENCSAEWLVIKVRIPGVITMDLIVN